MVVYEITQGFKHDTHTFNMYIYKILTLFWKKDAWKCDVVADIDIKLISSELGLCK